MDESPLRPARVGLPARDGFDAMYATPPPWDIGRPQPALAALAAGDRVSGRVIDVGCGTGEHSLMAARLGLDVVGVDSAPTAIALAERKAAAADLTVRYVVGDVLALAGLPEAAGPFDTALDSGLFHVFDDADRAAYVSSLHAVLRPGGHAFVLCFSDLEPGDWGPHRITEEQLRSSFATGWQIDSLARDSFTLLATRLDSSTQAQAWLTQLTRR